MAGILFLLDALAFVLVLHWAFERRGSKQANAETGWFGMRSTEADAAAAPQASAASSRRAAAPGPDRRTPRWKRL